MTQERISPLVENRQTFMARLSELPPADLIKIEFAYDLAKAAHRGQRRIGGERYFEHPRQATLILIDECGIRNPAIICATLLHDALEDTAVFGNPTNKSPEELEAYSKETIGRIFYPETAEIIFAVTEPYVDGAVIKNDHEAKEDKYRRLRENSQEALLVKLADRLHNLRTFFPKAGEKTPEVKIKETEEILIPIFVRAKDKYPENTSYLLQQINTAIAALKARTFEVFT
jgi:GTP diphosphokinase / guanosine-3',5'-bis(diphosphate) 3'-diphosphatase